MSSRSSRAWGLQSTFVSCDLLGRLVESPARLFADMVRVNLFGCAADFAFLPESAQPVQLLATQLPPLPFPKASRMISLVMAYSPVSTAASIALSCSVVKATLIFWISDIDIWSTEPPEWRP
jgi:hypothetical protein